MFYPRALNINHIPLSADWDFKWTRWGFVIPRETIGQIHALSGGSIEMRGPLFKFAARPA
jgi:hypothetical protein